MTPPNPEGAEPPPPKSESPGIAPPVQPLVLHSEDIFSGRREILIQHRESLYRLRITAQGRLILTK